MAGEIQLNGTTALTESGGAITLNNVNSATNRTNLGLGTAATSASTDFVGTSRTITAGTGLSGGGDLSANRTINVSFSANESNVKTAINASGSAPIYACRAFGRAGTGSATGNFVGQNLSYSKSSATHTFTFSTAPSNDDYTVVSSAGRYASYNWLVCITSKSASAFSLILSDISGAQQNDATEGVDVAVFF
jgi:hypothetical protein